MSIKVTESEISKVVYGSNAIIEKMLYIECACGSLVHMARVSFLRDILIQDPKDTTKNMIKEDLVSFEFNLTSKIEPAYTKIIKNNWDKFIVPFERFWNRVKGACKLLVGRPVWFSTDLLLDKESTEALANMLKKSLTDIDNVKI